LDSDEKTEKSTKTPRQRVQEKFDIAADLKKSRVKVSINDVQDIGNGAIKANYEISGLPTPKGGINDTYSSSYRTIPKSFINFDDFAKYSKLIFGMSDEDIIKLCTKN